MAYLISVSTEHNLDSNTVRILILDKDANGTIKEIYKNVDRRLLRTKEISSEELEEASDDDSVELDSLNILFDDL